MKLRVCLVLGITALFPNLAQNGHGEMTSRPAMSNVPSCNVHTLPSSHRRRNRVVEGRAEP
jgi:hypothetical protein